MIIIKRSTGYRQMQGVPEQNSSRFHCYLHSNFHQFPQSNPNWQRRQSHRALHHELTVHAMLIIPRAAEGMQKKVEAGMVSGIKSIFIIVRVWLDQHSLRLASTSADILPYPLESRREYPTLRGWIQASIPALIITPENQTSCDWQRKTIWVQRTCWSVAHVHAKSKIFHQTLATMINYQHIVILNSMFVSCLAMPTKAPFLRLFILSKLFFYTK